MQPLRECLQMGKNHIGGPIIPTPLFRLAINRCSKVIEKRPGHPWGPEQLLRKDCQNGKEFTESLSLIQGEAMRDRYVEKILTGTTKIRATHEERLALIESIEDPAIRQYADDTYVRLFGPAHLRPLMTSEERYEVMLSLHKDKILDPVLFRKEFEKRARKLISSRDQSAQK